MASFYLLVPGEGASGYCSAGGPLKKAHNLLCPRPLSFPCSLPVWFLGCQYPWCHGSSVFLSPACGWDSKLPNFKGPGKVCTHSRPYPRGCGAPVLCCPGRTVMQLTHTQARQSSCNSQRKAAAQSPTLSQKSSCTEAESIVVDSEKWKRGYLHSLVQVCCGSQWKAAGRLSALCAHLCPC